MDSHLIKTELFTHLKGEMAFMPITDLLNEISFEKLGERPNNLPYSFYEIFYHITFAQKDILRFLVDKTYEAPNWPDAYWPEEKSPHDKKAWKILKQDFLRDRKELETFLSSEENELMSPVKNATKDEQTHLREMLLVMEHNAYHTGQLLIILRLLNLHD